MADDKIILKADDLDGCLTAQDAADLERLEKLYAETGRVIAKLRDINTSHEEFVYYMQRAYEMLFRMAYIERHSDKKSHIVVKTPVTKPVQITAAISPAYTVPSCLKLKKRCPGKI